MNAFTNYFKTAGLLSLLTGLLVAIGYYIIGGSSGITIGLSLAAVMNLGSWFFSDKIALAAYNAQPVSKEQAPGMAAIVEELSQKVGIPTPSLYVIPSPAANAFATGRDPQHAAVAVTEGIVNLLSTEELAGVIGHELTHVVNRDTLTQAVAATVGGAISQLAYVAQWASFSGGYGRDGRRNANPLGLLLAAFLAPLAATLIQLAISRTREFAADAGAAQLTGNPRALATALQKLEQTARQMPLQGNPAFEPLLIMNAVSNQGGLMALFATHPPVETRIERLLQLEQQQQQPLVGSAQY